MKVQCLNGKWEGVCDGKFSFIGEVPGCSINDLVKCGKLPQDLLSNENADRVMDFENCDYVYKKSFTCFEIAKKSNLYFERIDTYADVYLNGKHLGYFENGNISHTIDISKSLSLGNNDLEVRLYSPITRTKNMPERSGAFTTERINTRRTQCSYGWDWTARFVGVGIGNVYIEQYDDCELLVDSVYVYTKSIDNGSAEIGVETTFRQKEKGRIVCFEIYSPNGQLLRKIEKYCDKKFLRFSLDILSPQLWYPADYGNQPLYEIKIKDEAKILHCEKFGIRTVRVLQFPDAPGSENYKKCLSIKKPAYDNNAEFSSFTLTVNGVKIMCKGANYVPCQPYPMPGKEEKITELLQLSKEMGVNMLRVWGGGAFECKHFYNECSRLGILVTQDFLMACGQYPETEKWFIDNLRLETEYAVKLLRNQPCLMWYSGDNENATGGCDTYKDYRGRKAFYNGIEPIVCELDPYRYCFASSPYGGEKYASNTVGTTHNTEFLGYLFEYIENNENLNDYKDEFKKFRARFIAEEPVFGAVSLTSLKKFMTTTDIFSSDTFMWLYHTKGNPCLNKELFSYFISFAEKLLGKFADSYDRFFKYKYLQYEWVRVVFEQARREKWFCSGIIFWMLNDCWTAASGWAFIDYFNKPKLSCYSFKRCSKTILCSFDRTDGKIFLNVINDGVTDQTIKINLYKITHNENSIIDCLDVTVKAGEVVTYNVSLDIKDNEILVAQYGREKAFYKNGGINIRPLKAGVDFSIDYNRNTVKLKANSYVHVVELEGDAIFEENGFAMTKGENIELSFRYLNDAVDREIKVETYTLCDLEKDFC